MPFCPTNGINLFYEEHGEGEPLVFAHGRGGNHLSWWQQIPAFADRFRCITFDHRSFGMSHDASEARGQDAFVEDLRGLLDHLAIERTHLVAQSMGGWTCLGFALAYPARTLSLVLADTTAGVSEPKILQAIKDHGGMPAELLDRVLGSSFRRKEPTLTFLYREIERLNHVGKTPAPFVHRGLKADDLARISVPRLVIVGSEDVATRPSVVAMFAEMLGARLETITGAGHSAYFENPSEFNRIVGHFLDEHRICKGSV